MQYDWHRIMTRDASMAGRLSDAAPHLPSLLQDYLRRHRATLEAKVQAAGPGSGIAAARFGAAMYDGLMDALFLAACGTLSGGFQARGVLAAVGSYGRNTLGLHSDIDVRLLVDRVDDQAESLARALLYPLWDAHVSVGYQVVDPRTLLDLASNDLRTATALLDWRHVSGDLARSSDLACGARQRLFDGSGARAFAERLEADTASRHERFGASVYLLEPDIKQGAGGLRDLDVALWVAKARWNVTRFEDLVRVGVLVPRELEEIRGAQAHLCRTRNQLHLLAGRRSDRLSFDRQEEVASRLGFGRGVEGAERFMSEHYQHAQRVQHARDLLLGRALEPSRPSPARRIAPGLVARDRQVALESPSALAFEPRLALAAYQHAVMRRMRVHPATREVLRRALRMSGFQTALRQVGDGHEAFLSLCTTVRETRLPQDSPLGDMHDVGLLTTFVPEFLPLVGRVHHDVYHVLTVDAHSVAAVDSLRRLARGEGWDPRGLFRRLAMEMARPTIVFLAVLLHDIGKAIGRTDHAVRGAPIAFEVAYRLGLCRDDAHEVAHLVRHHLALYHLATRRDIDDPDVHAEVARLVHGPEGLRELLLLTYVDVSTTSPDAMTEWKAALLERLFRAVESHLVGGTTRVLREAGVRSRITQACRDLAGDRDALRDFLSSMPDRYVLATEASRMAAHWKLASGRAVGAARVGAWPAHAGAASEVTVVVDDRPGVLASIAAALTASRVSVLEAQIHSRVRGDGRREAVDVFHIATPPHVDAPLVQRWASRVQASLDEILAGRVTADDLVRPRLRVGLGRASPAVRTKVVVDNRASSSFTVVEAFTRDRPGLLYLMAKTFRDLALTIQFAKINTEGTRVADVFYVCAANGAKVTDGSEVDEIERRLRASLDQPWEGS